MFANMILQDYKNKRELNINVNGSWIRIESNHDPVFKREPLDCDWYDADHIAVVDAITQLEKALLNAARPK